MLLLSRTRLIVSAAAAALWLGTTLPAAAVSQPLRVATIDAAVTQLAPSERVRVLVRLAQPATVARVQDVARRAGGLRVDHRYSVVRAFAATVTRAQAEALARVAGVRAVETDSRMKAFNDTAQSSFGVTKARADVGVDGNGDGSPTYSSGDFVEAVIDTGFDATHIDLVEG